MSLPHEEENVDLETTSPDDPMAKGLDGFLFPSVMGATLPPVPDLEAWVGVQAECARVAVSRACRLMAIGYDTLEWPPPAILRDAAQVGEQLVEGRDSEAFCRVITVAARSLLEFHPDLRYHVPNSNFFMLPKWFNDLTGQFASALDQMPGYRDVAEILRESAFQRQMLWSAHKREAEEFTHLQDSAITRCAFAIRKFLQEGLYNTLSASEEVLGDFRHSLESHIEDFQDILLLRRDLSGICKEYLTVRYELPHPLNEP